MKAVDIVIRGVSRQVDTVMDFLTTPKGVFETVDQIIRNARMTVKEVTGMSLGISGLKLLRR
ncbi:MAG TPA: hypothetical protein ENF41_04410 [Candidatus Bathyarchaeota archaeon]|nr:hypothetical protein [Candidatus Bathyarchaeota archaeon]